MPATYENSQAAATMAEPGQPRPTGARWQGLATLRVKLAAASAIAIAIVIGVLTIAGLRLAEENIANDLRSAARLTALAVADDLELRSEPFSSSSITAALHEFLDAAPELKNISLFAADDAGVHFAGGTSSASVEPDRLVTQVLKSGMPAEEDRGGDVTAAAAPVMRDGRLAGAVVVAVSLKPVSQLKAQGRGFAIGIAVISVFGIIAIVSMLAERLVHRPLGDVLAAVNRARAGDLTGRVNVARADEIGEVATGVNAMLSELEELHRSLHDRIFTATQALRERNEQLVRSYESVLGLREALGRAQELATVGRTLATVAHQIGTPLNLVSAHVQLLRQEVHDPSAQRRLSIIEAQIGRVTDNVRTLLEQTRPHAALRPVAIERLLNRLMDGVHVQASSSTVETSLEVSAGIPPVLADETQLELALMNLITNALDAMPDGGQLSITAGLRDDRVTIEVRDTGSGIAAELLSRVFEPWVTTKSGGRGTGLGLSITRDVIERSGGTIDVKSSPGTGTTFTVTLPVAQGVAA